MVLDTIEAWQIDEGDFLIINGEECVVTKFTDGREIFIIEFTDEFGNTNEIDASPFETFEIWGN